MHDKAAEWSRLSAEMQSLAAAAQVASRFGLVKAVEPSHGQLTGSAGEWSAGAGSEFDVLRGKLGNAASAYADNEADAARTAGTMND